MNRKRLIYLGKYLFLSLFSVLMLMMVFVYWLVSTSSGTAWLWGKLEDSADGAIRSTQVSGDLSSGFTIQALDYRTDELALSVQHAGLEAGLGWWPLSIQVRSLLLQDISVSIQPLEGQVSTADEKTDIHAMLESLSLPVPINIQIVEINNITLQSNEEPPVNLIENLSFQAVLEDSLIVDKLEVTTAALEAELSGRLQLQAPFAISAIASGVYQWSEDEVNAGFVVPFELESSGNLDQLQLQFVSAEHGMVMDGELHDPLIDPVWDISVIVDHIRLPVEQVDDVLSLSGVTLASKGGVNNWSFALDSTVESDTLQSSHLSISGSGSTSNIQINNAQLNGPHTGLQFSGALDWSSATRAELKANITQLDFSPWLHDWPAGKFLAGDFELNWSETMLHIPSARLTVAGTELVANIEADIDIEANKLDARLDWTGLSWPLADSTPEFASQAGKLSVSGSIDEWVGSGQANIQLGDYPQGQFEIRSNGDRTSGRLSILEGELLGGSVKGEAVANWMGGLTLDANLQTRGIDPESLLPGWPGHIDAELGLSVRSEPDQIKINLASLQGSLRGVPVDGHGGILIADKNVTFKELEIRTDEAMLQLNGNHADPDGVEVKFSGYLPSNLLQGARGSVEMEGRFSNDANHPVVQVQMEALDIAWNGLSVKTLSAKTKQSVNVGLLPAFQLDATVLGWQDTLVDEVSLSFNPVDEKYIVEANLLSEDASLHAAATLIPERPTEFFGSNWHGAFESLELLIDQTYSFKLSEPAAFDWVSASMSLEPLCLKDNKGAAMCASGAYQTNGNTSVLVDITAIPVNYFREILELDARFEQQFEGRLEFHQQNGEAPTGGADFKISAGRVLDLDDDDVLSETSEGRLAFTLQNGNLESGVLDMGLPGSGFIDVDFEVLNIMLDGQREIKGRAITHLEDIKLLGHLALPGVDDVGGSFDSNILLGGTVTDPAFSGGFKLSNGLIRYAPIGFTLEDLEFEGQLEKQDRGVLNGEFRAGEGIGSINGRFQFEGIENLRMDLTLAGERLLLADTDTLKILTETDLELKLSPQRLDINGRIGIPNARLTPANLILGGVNDSEDLVIENEEYNPEPDMLEEQSEYRIYGQLEVAFGDDVLIEVPGVKTNIMGSVVYNWSGDPVPVASGNYKLKGSVKVYGPTLQIRNGRISFPEVAANNPNLNIRAEREVFGNTQIRSAGVRVIGTLKKPVLEAYTVPLTNEDRAWTLLVTGSDFDQGQGVGGFDVGTYIAPKLYVSYGISLFEDENVVSARYDLKKGFGVKVTSGQRETGLDVSYTVDK